MKKLSISFVLLLFNTSLLLSQIWEARHNLSSSGYQQTLDNLTQKGYKPTEVNFVVVNGIPQYTAVWNYSPQTIWEMRYNLTPSEYQSYFDSFTPKGYVPTDVSVYTIGGVPRFSAIWEKMPTNTIWEARSNLNAAEFQAYFDRFSPQGYVPTEIAAYNIGSETRFAAVWVKKPGTIWESRGNRTPNEFQKDFDNFSNQGYIPTEMYAYTDNGVLKYGSVWQKTSGVQWEARFGLSSSEYQQKFNEMKANNYAPYIVNSYVVNGEIYYMGAWKKQYQPNVVASPSYTANTTIQKYNSKRSKILPIMPVFQQTQVWCWLAVGEMIFKHFGVPTVNAAGNYQCGIIGSISGTRSPCYQNCFNCVMPSGSNYGTISMLSNYSMIASNKRFYYSERKGLSENDVMTNIDNGQPIIAGTSYTSRNFNFDSEHVVLIVGYEVVNGQLYLVVNDPFNYTTFNPYINSGGKNLKSNQYLINYYDFRDKVFWNWAVFNINIR